MIRHRFALVFLAIFSLSTSRVTAAEPYLQFIEGLRQREYFDTAMDYLEQAEKRADLPDDIKAVIPFEKATTLLRLSRTQRNPEVAAASLNRAQAFFEQFLKASPDHPLAATANSDAANVLLNKGRLAVFQAKSPSNANKRGEYLKQARAYFEQARKLFQEAALKYDKQWQAFGVYVDKIKEAEKYEAKQDVEKLKVRAELDVGIVQYEEAQLYEKDDPKFKSTLKEASEIFEIIHQKHRSQVSGLYARVYQGKCFEEQGDLQKALGIYNELLSHQGESGQLKALQAMITYFKLICLNSEKRADYVLVDAEAQKWLKENPTMLRTRYGTGIRYEQARALEVMAKSRELKEEDKRRLLNDALGAARVINKSGLVEFRDVSQSMITRLMGALNRDGTDPKDFDTCYGMARELMNRIKETKEAVEGAKDSAEREQLKRVFDDNLKEAARLLNLALALRKPDTKLKDVNQVRYSVGVVYYEQKRSYDAAVMGEFVARRYADDKDGEMGAIPADSAFLAMAAYVQAYDLAGNADKQTDIRKMIEMTEFIGTKWPGTPKAIDSAITLGRMYIQTKDFVKAAEMLQKVPPEADSYFKVQVILGQALWDAARDGLNKPEAERPPPEKLAEYQAKAQDVLKKAIATLEPKLAENEPLTDDLADAKLYLAQMANQTGQYAEAIKLLETDKRSLLTVIAVKDGEARPAFGAKSGRFAQEVYKLILRAYIGLQNLDAARKAMAELEKIAAGQGQDILPIYIALGGQFKDELDRLAKSNVDQYQTVLKSFESFLGNMLARKEGQNYNSLAWIGAMYVSLGEATTDQAAAQKYFAEGSQAYSELLEKAAADAAFCTDKQLLVAKAQLVACKRKSGDFQAAVNLLKEVLAERPNSIDTQTEACFVYQDWAAAEQTDSQKQWEIAMRGDSALPANAPIGMWGWGELAKRLKQSPEVAKFTGVLLDARYNLAFCRYRSSKDLPSSKKMAGLALATAELQRTAMGVNLNDAQYAKFNALYREIETAMAKVPTDLTRSTSLVDESSVASSDADPEAPAAKKATSKRSKAKNKAKKAVASSKDQGGGSTMLAIIGFVVVGAAGGGFWFWKQNSQKKRPSRTSRAAAEPEPVLLNPVAASPVRKSASGSTGAPATKPKPPPKPKA